MRRTRSLGLGPILGHVQPLLDQVFIRLEMELQSVRAIAISKGLVRAGRRAREMHGVGRQVERVGMPLEDVRVAMEMATKRIAARGRGGMQAIPADLAHV